MHRSERETGQSETVMDGVAGRIGPGRTDQPQVWLVAPPPPPLVSSRRGHISGREVAHAAWRSCTLLRCCYIGQVHAVNAEYVAGVRDAMLCSPSLLALVAGFLTLAATATLHCSSRLIGF